MIVIATAGWSIPRTSAAGFPGDGTALQRYAGVLRGVEINTSFYRNHAPASYANWARQTPSAFRFAVKIPGSITHDGRLRATRRPLEEFLGTLKGLGRRLGPVVVQLPPSLTFDRRVARTFFTMLRERHAGPVVCEPRHVSWFEGGVDELLSRYHIARAAADPAIVPAAAVPGGWPHVVYYRLHGSPRKYWSIYDKERLAQWVVALSSLPRRTLAWCVFDNTASGGAAGNALQLLKMLGKKQ